MCIRICVYMYIYIYVYRSVSEILLILIIIVILVTFTSLKFIVYPYIILSLKSRLIVDFNRWVIYFMVKVGTISFIGTRIIAYVVTFNPCFIYTLWINIGYISLSRLDNTNSLLFVYLTQRVWTLITRVRLCNHIDHFLIFDLKSRCFHLNLPSKGLSSNYDFLLSF